MLDSVADDDEHVAIVAHVTGVAEPPVPRDDHRSTLGHVLGHRHVEHPVQRLDHPIDAATSAQINRRIHLTVVDVAGCNHICPPEKDDAVTIRHGIGHVKDLYGLVVEETVQRVLVGEVGVGRGVGRTCIQHPLLHVDMREDLLTRTGRRPSLVGRPFAEGAEHERPAKS